MASLYQKINGEAVPVLGGLRNSKVISFASSSGLHSTNISDAVDEVNTKTEDISTNLVAENNQPFRFGVQNNLYGHWVKEADTDVFRPFKGFNMIWLLASYSSGTIGRYTENVIEPQPNGLIPISITTYMTDNTLHATNNDYFTTTQQGTHNANITLKKKALYRANSSSQFVNKNIGDTLELRTMHANNVGAMLLFL